MTGGELGTLALPAAGSGHHATKLARSVYSGQIAGQLRVAIIGGALIAGSPLTEMRLAEQLSVSRGPIRSALHALEGEGLVRTMRNGRMQVVGFDEGDLRDLFAVRFELESLGIRWGVERAGDVGLVERAFARIEAEGASTPHLVDVDVDFHRALVELSGSRFLVQSWLALAPVISAVIAIGNSELVTRDPRSNFTRIVRSHGVLVEAVAAQDAVVATALLADQFELTKSMFGKTRRDDQ